MVVANSLTSEGSGKKYMLSSGPSSEGLGLYSYTTAGNVYASVAAEIAANDSTVSTVAAAGADSFAQITQMSCARKTAAAAAGADIQISCFCGPTASVSTG